MADASSLATIASIISAFGGAMLFFRIQRELAMQGAGEPIWIPWADRLLIAATLISLLLVVVPMRAAGPPTTLAPFATCCSDNCLYSRRGLHTIHPCALSDHLSWRSNRTAPARRTSGGGACLTGGHCSAGRRHLDVCGQERF